MWGHTKGVEDNNVGRKTFIDRMKHFDKEMGGKSKTHQI